LKKNVLNIFFCVFVILFSSNSFSQENLYAKLIPKAVDNLIDIRAVALNNTPIFKDDYSYLLFSLKRGSNGNYSRNSQSGKFSIEPGEQKELSTLKISIQKDEECKVYFFIRKFGQLVSKDSVVIYAAEKIIDKKIEESDFEIKGIVVDNAITKIGKDFFDYFYQSYNSSGVKYPFIITIKEKPYFGRSSIISVEVDDRKLIEFNSKPDEDFLRSYVRQTLQKLNMYSKQRKLLYKNSRI